MRDSEDDPHGSARSPDFNRDFSKFAATLDCSDLPAEAVAAAEPNISEAAMVNPVDSSDVSGAFWKLSDATVG